MRRLLFVIGILSVLQTAPAIAEPFWWGVATSPYQTEDAGPFKTDWDLFFEGGRLKESKRNGTNSYIQTERDLGMLQWLGVSHYRFGIEWARVEPQPGVYDEAAIEHYVQLARDLVARGIDPLVCLWHFTFPSWATDLKHPRNHGWRNPTLQARWPEYVRLMTERLSPYVKYYLPQNEPNVAALLGYIQGKFPPGRFFHLGWYREQIEAAAQAFIQASGIIKQVRPDAQVITIQHLAYIQPGKLQITGAIHKLSEEFNYRHLDRVHEHADMIGFNYYFKIVGTVLDFIREKRRTYPEGLHYFVERLSKRYGKPMIVTENGARTTDEIVRRQYMLDHVAQVRQAIADGYDVRGYFYWSLWDNYEWSEGWASRYGMFDLGPKGGAPRPVAEAYRDLILAKPTQEIQE